ncbi:MAP kinase kinase kinase wis4 (MAP kinase kinase kinase wak1) (MAP kinase kinase kinase wik1) [Durusdinium trenchii]|uniref:MAP kinase kinase kinase wis4 (MAP kinase kinase kinase wak1) (MAP kinase kinase kinase wik1) n=1 Tax=Durusdinium trenchii TaxID=1381693 RepID=A0ABP0LWI3_9DINO
MVVCKASLCLLLAVLLSLAAFALEYLAQRISELHMEQSELLCPSAAADCAPLAERPELEDLEGVAVKRYGLGFFPDLLNDSLQSELRTYVQLNSPAGGKAHEPRRVLLDLHDLPVQRAVLAAMSDAPLRAVLEELLGKDAALVELAAKHSSYGSWSQSWHKDAVTCTGNAESYTLLIPLQETTGESGAEALCVGTHRCLLGDSDCDDFGDGQSIHATAGGTGVLMHRSLYHRGCAHTAASAPDAVMFYISWMSSHGLMPPGTYAMRRDHFGRTMDDILTGWCLVPEVVDSAIEWSWLPGYIVRALLGAPYIAAVRDLTWSPDGDALLAASTDGSARVWRLGGNASRIHVETAEAPNATEVEEEVEEGLVEDNWTNGSNVSGPSTAWRRLQPPKVQGLLLEPWEVFSMLQQPDTAVAVDWSSNESALGRVLVGMRERTACSMSAGRVWPCAEHGRERELGATYLGLEHSAAIWHSSKDMPKRWALEATFEDRRQRRRRTDLGAGGHGLPWQRVSLLEVAEWGRAHSNSVIRIEVDKGEGSRKHEHQREQRRRKHGDDSRGRKPWPAEIPEKPETAAAVLGHSRFGSVHKVSGEVAVRHMLGDMVNLTSEIQMLERAQGHGVIQLLGCAILPTEAFLYLELCEGDLKGQVWREDALAPMVAQPRDAVCHIHKLHIIHMDIKPANILVKSGKPVLSDFGRACLEADVSAAREWRGGNQFGQQRFDFLAACLCFDTDVRATALARSFDWLLPSQQ